jgi:hypothetical protein
MQQQPKLRFTFNALTANTSTDLEFMVWLDVEKWLTQGNYEQARTVIKHNNLDHWLKLIMVNIGVDNENKWVNLSMVQRDPPHVKRDVSIDHYHLTPDELNVWWIIYAQLVRNNYDNARAAAIRNGLPHWLELIAIKTEDSDDYVNLSVVN